MEIEELKKLDLDGLVQRKQWCMRSNAHGNMDKWQMDKELAYIEPEVRRLTQIRLREETEKLRSKIETTKKTIFQDGDMKRAIARELIKILAPSLSEKEMKGVFRQAYKILRGRA